MKFLKSIVPYIIVIIVVVIVRSFMITPIKVSGDSMVPTLSGGDIMLLNKLSNIDRYDIVVIDENSDNIIKRVYGMPGETIEIKNHKIYVNDEEIEDKYGMGDTNNIYNMPKLVLGDDEYFVLGDNREISLDSRILGAINRQKIKGTASFIIFPFTRFGTVE